MADEQVGHLLQHLHSSPMVPSGDPGSGQSISEHLNSKKLILAEMPNAFHEPR